MDLYYSNKGGEGASCPPLLDHYLQTVDGSLHLI